MAKGVKTGGRRKGSLNKSNAIPRDIALELGVDPFKILLYFAKGDWASLGYSSSTREVVSKGVIIEQEVITPEIRVNAAKEAAQYIHPKRKAVDEMGKAEEPNSNIVFVSDWGGTFEPTDHRNIVKNEDV